MSTTATILRRTALLALLTLTVVATISSRRRRNDLAGPVAAPEWPKFDEIEVDTPTTRTWMPALDDDVVPDGFPVKVKLSSGIFHVPGGRFYERTKADRWYATTGAAEADGYRRSKT